MQTRAEGNSQANQGQRRLGYREAKASPCLTCPTSPCCSYLPLHKFRITSLFELDHAVYLLGFDRIELGLASSGEWSAHYRHPCRFLSREDRGCTVHGTDAQPHICRRYNPYQCWYRRALADGSDDEFLRIDRRRMDVILERIVFGQDRQILEVPAWDTLTEAFSELPIEDDGVMLAAATSEESPLPTPAGAATESPTTAAPAFAFGDAALREPCTGCSAPCCGTLVFPQGVPTIASNLDYFRFSLGFPGVELGISDNSWTLVVRTNCRHLQDHRCAIYGTTERPLICSYYDEWTCTYRWQYGQSHPPGFVRVGLEAFDALVSTIQFDASGAVLGLPPVEVLAAHVTGQA